jgi:hypothetical protein
VHSQPAQGNEHRCYAHWIDAISSFVRAHACKHTFSAPARPGTAAKPAAVAAAAEYSQLTAHLGSSTAQ